MRSIADMRLLPALAVVLACPGCFAVSVRTHVGAVATEVGSGLQAGLSFGLGLPINRHSAAMAGPGVVTGNAPKLGVAVVCDYVRLPDPDDPIGFAWRAGLGGEFALAGQPSLFGPHFAAMYVVRDRFATDHGSEKFGRSSWDRSVVAFGIEGRIGAALRITDDDDVEGLPNEHRAVGASLSLTAEWILLSWMKM